MGVMDVDLGRYAVCGHRRVHLGGQHFRQACALRPPIRCGPANALKAVLFVSEQIGGASYACLVWVTGAAQRGLPHEGMPTLIAAGTGTTIR